MFCADYIASFIYHAALTLGLAKAKKSSEYGDQLSRFQSAPLHLYSLGAAAGFMGAASVFPFDFVRRGALPGQKVTLRHGMSTVPYATVFFGLYFHNRDRESTPSQCKWALASAAGAALAEIPFDKAKLAMMGDRKTMVFASLLYVPFGALMLVMYDKALPKLQERVDKMDF